MPTTRPSSPPSIMRSTTFDEFCGNFCGPSSPTQNQRHGYVTPVSSTITSPPVNRPPPFIFRSVTIEIDLDEDTLDSGLLLPMDDEDDNDDYPQELCLKPRFRSMELDTPFAGRMQLPSLEDDGVSMLHEESLADENEYGNASYEFYHPAAEERETQSASTLYSEQRVPPSGSIEASMNEQQLADVFAKQAGILPRPPLPCRVRRQSFGAFAA